jgi:hypothetical protein
MTKRKAKSPLMTLREAHEHIGSVGYATVWRWAQRGELPTVKIARKTFVLREEFMKMLQPPSRAA